MFSAYFLFVQVLQQPHGITIFEDHVYWTDRYTSQIMMTNKFHGGNTTVLMSAIYQGMGITIDHSIKQPSGQISTWVANKTKTLFFVTVNNKVC